MHMTFVNMSHVFIIHLSFILKIHHKPCFTKLKRLVRVFEILTFSLKIYNLITYLYNSTMGKKPNVLNKIISFDDHVFGCWLQRTRRDFKL